jgi:hypothetical protein
MPIEGKSQKPAGVKKDMSGPYNTTKTMVCGKVWKIKPQEYTAGPNAVMQANK